MNRRQTQRTLADVISKCQAAHVQLPIDVFEGMASAGEALRHSRVMGKLHVDDAVDELKQRYGLEPKWQQLADEVDAKLKNRQKRHRLRRGDEATAADSAKAKPQSRKTSVGSDRPVPSETESASADPGSASTSESELKPSPKKPRATPKSPPGRHDTGTSPIDRIIQHHPAKNPANEELAEEFVELGGYELTHGEKQKGISRMAVAKQIRDAEETIESGAQAGHLPHVGPSAAAKIDEVLQRGKMKELEEFEAETADDKPKSTASK